MPGCSRVYGGAVIRKGVSNIGYEERRRLHDEAKAAIARTCARPFPTNSSLFLNIGTTTEQWRANCSAIAT